MPGKSLLKIEKAAYPARRRLVLKDRNQIAKLLQGLCQNLTQPKFRCFGNNNVSSRNMCSSVPINCQTRGKGSWMHGKNRIRLTVVGPPTAPASPSTPPHTQVSSPPSCAKALSAVAARPPSASTARFLAAAGPNPTEKEAPCS